MQGALSYNVGAESPASMSSAAELKAREVVEKGYVGLGREAVGGAVLEEAEEEEEGNTNEEEEEDLELGLTLGKKKVVAGGGTATPWTQQRCRILTAKDFPSLMYRASPRSSSSTSSVSSSSATNSGGGGAGTKRAAADSVSPDHDRGSPHPQTQVVVGWPPIRAFRMNSLFNHSKDNNSEAAETAALAAVKKANHQNSNDNDDDGSDKSAKAGHGRKDQETKGNATGSCHLVKVKMDGDPIGRKIDLSAHHSYEALAITLELMFHKPTITTHGRKGSKLFDGSSELALTYEDKDGDWMLVGDVPWGMFLDTVKRLRIMRTSDANGLDPRFQSSDKINGVLRSKP